MVSSRSLFRLDREGSMHKRKPESDFLNLRSQIRKRPRLRASTSSTPDVALFEPQCPKKYRRNSVGEENLPKYHEPEKNHNLRKTGCNRL
ncbi:hypothetical protein KSP39_PZI022453 [Platanthera zijinensis]|uniref:Uncharacterized protein n=1 Tax=Platanthera zijinensis TaxID=2320716 RepID=A0AAP0AV56_9ASPA